MITANEIIKRLNLQTLPLEGGYYRETYRAKEIIASESLPERYSQAKHFATAIYYLHTPETRSLLHKLPTDEIYHFYLGDPVELLLLYPDGTSELIILGPHMDLGEQVQVVIPRDTWQGSMLKKGGRFALIGTTMAPAFDRSDFTGGDESLIQKYADRKEMITKLL
ncbi:cupin domain-containing protein [candidate division KSB1 bacterium]|nr:cupin domain-containing protein [candidate division KSB1 bacterium]